MYETICPRGRIKGFTSCRWYISKQCNGIQDRRGPAKMFIWQSVKRNVSRFRAEQLGPWVLIRSIRCIRLAENLVLASGSRVVGVAFVDSHALMPHHAVFCVWDHVAFHVWLHIEFYTQDFVFSEGCHVSNEPRTSPPQPEQTSLHPRTWQQFPSHERRCWSLSAKGQQFWSCGSYVWYAPDRVFPGCTCGQCCSTNSCPHLWWCDMNVIQKQKGNFFFFIIGILIDAFSISPVTGFPRNPSRKCLEIVHKCPLGIKELIQFWPKLKYSLDNSTRNNMSDIQHHKVMEQRVPDVLQFFPLNMSST